MAATDKKRAPLGSTMGRPKRGPLGDYSAILRQKIKQLRLDHPGWGAATLRSELVQSGRWRVEELPSERTIGRYLKHLGLSKGSGLYRSSLPVEVCRKAKRSHSLWQIDGQGTIEVNGVGNIAMLNIKDVASSVYITSFPAQMKTKQSHPNTSDYKTAMRLGFLHHGLPRKIQSDHASVFYDNRSKSPFPTLFCLWLVSLGIRLCYSRFNRPTDQGQVERAHQTLFNQVIYGQQYDNWEALFHFCEKRRQQLNEAIPSRATNKLSPLKKDPKARHSGKYYHPQQEAQMINLNRVFVFLSRGKWYRKVGSNNTVCLGGQIYYIPKAKPRKQLVITFCRKSKQLMFQNDKELLIAQMPLKGINRDSLMGRLYKIYALPNFQLELPLFWEIQKINTTF